MIVKKLTIKKIIKKVLTSEPKDVIIETDKEREEQTMTLTTLETLTNNDGITLKRYKSITYKTGYQVATEGRETRDAKEALRMIEEYEGNCGVWYSEGIYYIDKSHRVNTKREALTVGRACKQISVLKWSNMSLIYC